MTAADTADAAAGAGTGAGAGAAVNLANGIDCDGAVAPAPPLLNRLHQPGYTVKPVQPEVALHFC